MIEVHTRLQYYYRSEGRAGRTGKGGGDQLAHQVLATLLWVIMLLQSAACELDGALAAEYIPEAVTCQQQELVLCLQSVTHHLHVAEPHLMDENNTSIHQYLYRFCAGRCTIIKCFPDMCSHVSFPWYNSYHSMEKQTGHHSAITGTLMSSHGRVLEN